jgi:hypothetical protein
MVGMNFRLFAGWQVGKFSGFVNKLKVTGFLDSGSESRTSNLKPANRTC